MCCELSHDDQYEYRLVYQYKDGKVEASNQIDDSESEALEHLERFKKSNSWMLLVDPWIERRQILKWKRVTHI